MFLYPCRVYLMFTTGRKIHKTASQSACPFMALICCKITYLWYKTVKIYVYIKESIKINY